MLPAGQGGHKQNGKAEQHGDARRGIRVTMRTGGSPPSKERS